MTEEQIKALLNMIKEVEKCSFTGNIQMNYFKGQCGTVQKLESYKLDALVAIYGDDKI